MKRCRQDSILQGELRVEHWAPLSNLLVSLPLQLTEVLLKGGFLEAMGSN